MLRRKRDKVAQTPVSQWRAGVYMFDSGGCDWSPKRNPVLNDLGWSTHPHATVANLETTTCDRGSRLPLFMKSLVNASSRAVRPD